MQIIPEIQRICSSIVKKLGQNSKLGRNKIHWAEEVMKQQYTKTLIENEKQKFNFANLGGFCLSLFLSSVLSMGGELVDNKFTWVIPKVSSKTSDLVFSYYFVIGGCSWRVVAYSKENNFKKCLSVTLIVAEGSSKALDFEWTRYAKLSITLINQLSEKLNQRFETLFDDRKSTWSNCETMFSIEKLDKQYGGFMVNEEIKIVVEFLEIIDKFVVFKEPYQRPMKKTKLNDDGAVSKDSMESIGVNGFQVLPSQVESVKRIFENHIDLALKFRPKNPILKTAYMNVLLNLTEIVRKSPEEISDNDLVGAYGSLRSMKEAGFKLDWLEKKLNEVAEKKEMKEVYESRIQEIEKELKDLKAKVLAARAPLKLDDVF